MHPRHAHRARLRLDCARDAGDDSVSRRVRRGVVERHIPHARAGPRRRVPNRLVVRVVIVLGGEDVLIGADAEAVIRHRQCAGRIRREADFLRHAADVVGERALHRDDRPALGIGERGALDPGGIGVNLLPEVFDCLGDRLRMRHEKEAGQMDPVGREREQRTHGVPVHVAIRLADRHRRDRRGAKAARRGIAATGGRPRQPGTNRSHRHEPLTATDGHR